MKTLDQYFPAMKEAPGRLFVPRASINALAAVALLAGVMAYAIHYPTMKENEAIQRLAQINDLITSSTAATQASINHLPVLVTGSPALQSVAKTAVTTLQGRLDPNKPVTLDHIRTAWQNRRDEYAQAQALIAISPFRGVSVDQVPATADGQAYLNALKVTPPPREYQQIDTGTLDALSRYRAVLVVQSTAAKVEHQIDVEVNGDKAAPAKTAVVPPDMPQIATQEPQPSPTVSAFGQSKGTPQPVAQAGGGDSDVQRQIAAGQQQAQPQVPAAELAAQQALQQKDLAARQAQAAQERAAKQRELAQEQAKERAERAQQAALLKEQQAQQQAAQHAQQQQELAARQAQEAQQQAQQAAAEKARQCTSSLFARVSCASQGYNPITGQKS